MNKEGGIQIGFIDSYSTNASRLQGMGKIESVLLVTLPGHDWDGLSDVGAASIEINIDKEATKKFFSDDLIYKLEMASRFFGTSRSIVARPTRAAVRLKRLGVHFFRRLHKIDSRINLQIGGPCLELPEISGFGTVYDLFDEEALLEMVENVLEEIIISPAGEEVSSAARRELALKIERIIWQPSFYTNSYKDICLDDLSEYFKVNRRTIQIAIQEQFGLGFLALRRVIRLHQIRSSIRSEKSKTISEVASEYYVFEFGRLSKSYKELFGVLPSIDRKKLSRSGRLLGFLTNKSGFDLCQSFMA